MNKDSAMAPFRFALVSTFCAAIFGCFAVSASATPIVFNFDSDTANPTTHSDTVSGLTLIYLGAGEVCPTGLSGLSISGNALITDSCGSQAIGGTFVIFSSLLSSVSFGFLLSDNSSLDVIYANLGSSTASGSTSLTGTPFGPFSVGSVTLSSSVPFNVIEFDPNATGPDYALDNFSATLAPVPEPSSIALLSTGILGVAGAVRRRLKA
jgi:hypothetical protein